MRVVFKLLSVAFGIAILALSSFGQQQSVAFKSNGWQNLYLDKSTPEDAIRAFGQPASDKSDSLHIRNIDKWMKPNYQQKIFRVLTYKGVGESKKAEFAFLENKLVRIYLEYGEKKILAKDLGKLFGVDFVLVERGVPSNSTPAMYEGQKESLVPKVYPAIYYLVSVTPQSLISASVFGGRGKAVLKEAFRIQTIEPFPGSLITVDIVSRSLSKTDSNKSSGQTGN